MGCCSSEPPTPRTVPLQGSSDNKTQQTLDDPMTPPETAAPPNTPFTPDAASTQPNPPSHATIAALANSAEMSEITNNNEHKPSNTTDTKEAEEPVPFASLDTIVATFSGLHDIYSMYADHNTMMDMEGLTIALKVFGLKIDTNHDLQKQVWAQFDLDGKEEIDYNDFSATMSALIDSMNEDSLFLFFQIFDYDSSGFLELEELAEMLFSQQKIAAAVTNQPALITEASNKECLKRVQTFLRDNDDNGDGKISFEEYNKWRREHRIVLPIKS